MNKTWDGTITCVCGMKKHIGISGSMYDCVDRMQLIDHEQAKARCCPRPDYYMYPPKNEYKL